jgi:hypothetical protein
MERYPTPASLSFRNVATLDTGLTRDAITLPAVERVIGGETSLDNHPDKTNPGVPLLPATQELRLCHDIVGAISQVGSSRLTTYMG